MEKENDLLTTGSRINSLLIDDTEVEEMFVLHDHDMKDFVTTFAEREEQSNLVLWQQESDRASYLPYHLIVLTSTTNHTHSQGHGAIH